METEKIFEAVNAVMADVGAVGKNRTNEQQKYRFRGVEDVMNALSPAFIKNKIFCVLCEKKGTGRTEKCQRREFDLYTDRSGVYLLFGRG